MRATGRSWTRQASTGEDPTRRLNALSASAQREGCNEQDGTERDAGDALRAA